MCRPCQEVRTHSSEDSASRYRKRLREPAIAILRADGERVLAGGDDPVVLAVFTSEGVGRGLVAVDKLAVEQKLDRAERNALGPGTQALPAVVLAKFLGRRDDDGLCAIGTRGEIAVPPRAQRLGVAQQAHGAPVLRPAQHALDREAGRQRDGDPAGTRPGDQDAAHAHHGDRDERQVPAGQPVAAAAAALDAGTGEDAGSTETGDAASIGANRAGPSDTFIDDRYSNGDANSFSWGKAHARYSNGPRVGIVRRSRSVPPRISAGRYGSVIVMLVS